MEKLDRINFAEEYSEPDLELLNGFKSIREMANSLDTNQRNNKKKSLMRIRDRNSFSMFHSFVHYFLRYTIPKKVFASQCSKMKISDLFTPADEAFCLLCMMNYWDEWEYRHKHRNDLMHVITKSNRRTYWTGRTNESDSDISSLSSNETVDTDETGSRSRGMTANRRKNSDKSEYICGWNKEGRKRFNEILKHIVTVRNNGGRHAEFEKQILDKYIAEEMKKNSRKRKRDTDIDSGDDDDDEVLDMYNVTAL